MKKLGLDFLMQFWFLDLIPHASQHIWFEWKCAYPLTCMDPSPSNVKEDETHCAVEFYNLRAHSSYLAKQYGPELCSNKNDWSNIQDHSSRKGQSSFTYMHNARSYVCEADTSTYYYAHHRITGRRKDMGTERTRHRKAGRRNITMTRRRCFYPLYASWWNTRSWICVHVSLGQQCGSSPIK